MAYKMPTQYVSIYSVHHQKEEQRLHSQRVNKHKTNNHPVARVFASGVGGCGLNSGQIYQ